MFKVILFTDKSETSLDCSLRIPLKHIFQLNNQKPHSIVDSEYLQMYIFFENQ